MDCDTKRATSRIWRRGWIGGFSLGGHRRRRREFDGAVGRDHLGDGVFEGFDAFAGDGGDVVEGELAALGHGGEFFELVGIGYVDLGGDEDGRLGGEGGVEAFELFGDDFEVVRRGRGGRCLRAALAVGDVDEVDDDAGALDVFEELDAEAVRRGARLR